MGAIIFLKMGGQNMKTFLFQGDSITDAGRGREEDGYRMGNGYATVASALLGEKYPGMTFINRGVSGNRIVDLYSRIKFDCINLKPDYMSILIGVNDVWHEVSKQNGVSAEKFEKVYSMYIEEIKEALPDIKIIILEPFVLNGRATQDAWDYFKTETKLRGEAAKRVAQKYGLSFVSLQDKFDEAMEKYNDSAYWTADGVHPTPAGHAIIGKALTTEFEKIK